MKVLQLVYESPDSPFGFGGAGFRAQKIYHRLSQRHKITLLYMKYPGAKNFEEDNIKHIFLGTESSNIVKSVIFYTFKVAKFIKKHGHEFDIIVENFLPCMPFCSTLLTKTPVIFQVQGIMGKHAFRKYNFFFALPMYVIEKIYPKMFCKFMFVSPVTRNQLLSQLKKKDLSVYLVPNGIDEVFLNSVGKDKNYILFFSRIDKYQKGIDVLIRAFSLVSKKYPELRLVLSGYELDNFRKLIRDYPQEIQDKIEYVGFVTGDRKLRILLDAKIFVLPSRYESQPISVIEAAACGKPVIVSDIPELKFVVDNGFGISFYVDSIIDLQRKIEFMIENDEIRQHMGMKGREFARNFTWDKISDEYEKVLYDVVNSG